MVCDAGGGTTVRIVSMMFKLIDISDSLKDMCILQVERVEEGILKLENLMNPEGMCFLC